MRKRFEKIAVVLLGGALAVSLLAGCSGDQNAASTAATTAAKQESTAAPAQDSAAAAEQETAAVEETASVYPMEAGEPVSLWWQMAAAASRNYTSLGDTVFGQTWSEKTGIEIEWQHPTGSAQTQLNLIIADGDYPDLIHYNWLSYGPLKAIEEGVIIELNDVIDQYMPNLKKYLEEHPDIDKMIKTDDGIYYEFPWVKVPATTYGLVVRQDWLDDLGLAMPETIDEWETVFRAFKEEKGATAPWSTRYGTSSGSRDWDPFLDAQGVLRTFFVGDDGKIHMAQMEDGQKQYLELYQRWYKEGLLDVDFASIDESQLNSKILNGETGATFVDIGKIESLNAAADEEGFKLVAAPYPVLKKGDVCPTAHYSQAYTGAYGVAISGTCKDVERAARLIDWLYGEEGHMLVNFGIEGETYEMVNGYPTYTEFITDNPQRLSITEALSGYTMAYAYGPFVTDERYQEQYYGLDEETANAYEIWQNTDVKKHILPPVSLTLEESEENSVIMSDVWDYSNEWQTKVIMGEESLDNWDTYIQNMENMGALRAIEIQQAAYDRYMNR